MALTKCKECGHEIAKSAAACPNCGAKVKRTGCFTMGVAVLFALVGVSAVIGSCEEGRKSGADAERAAANRTAEAESKKAEQARLAAMTPEDRATEKKRLADEAEKQRLVRQAEAKQAEQATLRRQGLIWNYRNYTDDLTGKQVTAAWLNSVNEVNFDFPYQGAQRAQLTLRKHPKYGNDVILQIEKGQFVCGISDCTVSVRFDNGPVQQFGVVEPEDHSSEVLFFSNYSRMVQQLLKAKRLYVAAVVYQEGSPTFEFNVEGLEWK